MLENRPPDESPRTTTPKSEDPNLPPSPEVDPLTLLCEHPDRTHAVPTFLRTEGISHEQLLALFEKLEFPVSIEGIKQIEEFLRKSRPALSPSTFLDSEIDGCPVAMLVSATHRVGEGSHKEVRTITIAPMDVTAPFFAVKVALDVADIEEGLFNVMIEFDIDRLYGSGLQRKSWLELDTLLESLNHDPLPESLTGLTCFCDVNEDNQPCVVASVGEYSLLGMLPLEQNSPEAGEQAQPTESSTLTTLSERDPRYIVVYNPTLTEMRAIARELGDGSTSALTEFEISEGERSFLANAGRFVGGDSDMNDLNIWSLYSMREQMMVRVSQELIIGDSEHGVGMSYSASAYCGTPEEDPESEYSEAEFDSDQEPQEEDSQEQDEQEQPSYGLMSDVSNYDITINPYGEGRDVTLALSMDEQQISEDGSERSEPALAVTLHLHASLSRRERWEIVDRICKFCEGEVLSTNQDFKMLRRDAPFISLERVGILLPWVAGKPDER